MKAFFTLIVLVLSISSLWAQLVSAEVVDPQEFNTKIGPAEFDNLTVEVEFQGAFANVTFDL